MRQTGGQNKLKQIKQSYKNRRMNKNLEGRNGNKSAKEASKKDIKTSLTGRRRKPCLSGV